MVDMTLVRNTLAAWLSTALVSTQAMATVAASTATTSTMPSTGDSLSRMVFGTVVVLLVIAVIAWLLRRVLPGQSLSQRGVIKQVGGLQLGPRERVVVLEVAGRWLVVGINAGQMSALGEVDPPATDTPENNPSTAASSTSPATVVDPQAPFAVRLQQAMQATVQQTVKSLKNKP